MTRNSTAQTRSRGLVAGIYLLLLIVLAALIVAACFGADAVAKPTPAKGGRVAPCRSVPCFRKALAWQRHDRAKLRHQLAVRWHPSVVTAIELASRVSGVSFSRLWTISGCESTHDPLNVLGQYEGLFQLGAYHRSLPDIRGLNPFDPYVNAMHAALFIAHNGEGQWSCRSDGSVHAGG